MRNGRTVFQEHWGGGRRGQREKDRTPSGDGRDEPSGPATWCQVRNGCVTGGDPGGARGEIHRYAGVYLKGRKARKRVRNAPKVSRLVGKQRFPSLRMSRSRSGTRPRGKSWGEPLRGAPLGRRAAAGERKQSVDLSVTGKEMKWRVRSMPESGHSELLQQQKITVTQMFTYNRAAPGGRIRVRFVA
jgi:hypothetical protein